MLVSQFYPDPAEPARLLLDVIDPGKFSEHPRFTKSRREVEDARQKSFVTPLRAQMERALIPDKQPQSLIIEGLAHHSRRTVFRGDDRDAKKKVVLVGDMLEFSTSSGCSAYPLTADKSTKNQRRPLAERCRQLVQDFPGRFRGAEIEILLIWRGRQNGVALQPAELKEFYENWFRTAGAHNVIWKEIR